MIIKTFKDSERKEILLKIRSLKEGNEFWFDIWENNKPLSPTVCLKKSQVKRLIKFLERVEE